jgi:plasmid replication initiation protein
MEDLIVYKHNELIENFVFNATEAELQIMNYAVATTNPTWENKYIIYKITIPDLVALYKTKSNSAYKDYRNALDRMMKRTYTYYREDGSKHTENLVIRVSEWPNDTSFIVFKFNEYISHRITNLQGLFTKYDIKHIAMFKSRYAFMLYEFFKLHLNQANHFDSPIFRRKLSVEDFKKNLGVEDKYKIFRDLEKDVIKKAKKNINDHSDISMNYTVTRKARTPTHIVLSAQYKKGKAKKSPEDQIELTFSTPDNTKITHASDMSAEQKTKVRKELDIFR